jgi:DNA replication initiation complex subunit (GINS family)
MAQLFSASLDVSKISKDKLVKGEKGTYLNITISINDEADKYGNVLTITESQTQEERESKASKIYLANGKLVWSTEGGSTAKQKAATPTPPPIIEEDDLGF